MRKRETDGNKGLRTHTLANELLIGRQPDEKEEEERELTQAEAVCVITCSVSF